TLARLRVLVEMCAVELRQREGVAWEMRRHPVEYHAEAATVQIVDEPGEILRRPIAMRRGKKSGDLITPRAIERMLRQRHHLDVRETHLDGIVGELRGKLAIIQRT